MNSSASESKKKKTTEPFQIKTGVPNWFRRRSFHVLWIQCIRLGSWEVRSPKRAFKFFCVLFSRPDWSLYHFQILALTMSYYFTMNLTNWDVLVSVLASPKSSSIFFLCFVFNCFVRKNTPWKSQQISPANALIFNISKPLNYVVSAPTCCLTFLKQTAAGMF